MLTTKKLDAMAAMANILHQNPELYLEELANLKAQITDVTPEDRKKWLKENYNTQEFAAAVRYRIMVDVLANLYALSFFQNTPLKDDEWPMIDILKRDGTIKVGYIGEANGQTKRQRVDRRSHQQYLLQKYATDLYEYQLMDLQIGNVAEVDRVQQEIEYELSLGLDQNALTLLKSMALTSGLRATLNLHKAIVSANIPDKNSFNFQNGGADDSGDGAGANGKITLEKMKRVLDYFVRFSGDVELDGAPLAIKTIYVSAVNKRDLWDFCSLVAGYNLAGAVQDPKNTIPFDAKTEIWRSGKLEEMFGQQFNIIPRNTIQAGDAQVASNKPAGWYFNKPSMAETLMDTSLELRQKNTGRMGMTVVNSFVLPAPWTYRYMIVKF